MIEGRESELPDFEVFRTVIKYCLIILFVPALTFFVVKLVVFDGLLELSHVNSSVYSAIIAIIVLHFSLGLYIYTAYSDSNKSPPPKPTKKD